MIEDHPHRVIMTNEPVTCACFHPTNKGLVIGALRSGRLGVWSLVDGSMVSVSNLTEQCHMNAVVG